MPCFILCSQYNSSSWYFCSLIRPLKTRTLHVHEAIAITFTTRFCFGENIVLPKPWNILNLFGERYSVLEFQKNIYVKAFRCILHHTHKHGVRMLLEYSTKRLSDKVRSVKHSEQSVCLKCTVNIMKKEMFSSLNIFCVEFLDLIQRDFVT